MSKKIEWGPRRPDTIPPSGNQWRQHYWLSPPVWQEVTVMGEALRDFVTTLQRDLVQPEWKFTSLAVSPGDLTVIFTHPLKVALSNHPPLLDDFLKLEVITEKQAGFWSPLKTNGRISQVLEGTNLYCEGASAVYNRTSWERRQKFLLLWQQVEGGTSYQTGVGLIKLQLSPLEKVIQELDERIVNRTPYYMPDGCEPSSFAIPIYPSDEHLKELAEQRDHLASLVVPSPRVLIPESNLTR